MSINQKCHGLIKSNELYSNVSDIIPLRVAVLDGCHFTLIYYFNIMMKALKRPFVLTYCDSYGGPGRSIQDELYSNRSEFSPNLMEVNHDWYQNIQYSPSFFFGNAITILTGKIIGQQWKRIFDSEQFFITSVVNIFCHTYSNSYFQ